MFSEKIVCSDAFMEMPTSTQALYFHLGMKVDDDGFVNPKMIMRMIGANEDELKVLIGKKFVIPFQNGVIVLKHHRINNNFDKYNYRPTVYSEELKTLYIKENNAYTQDESQGIPIQTVSRLETVGKKSLEEKRIEENRRDKNKVKEEVLEIPESINKEAWNEWESYRKERKLSSYKNRSKKVVWNFLAEYSKEDQMKVINQSIKNNWQGLFELKDKQKVGGSIKI